MAEGGVEVPIVTFETDKHTGANYMSFATDPFSQLSFVKVKAIGSGMSGKVLLMKDKDMPNTEVAAKIIDFSKKEKAAFRRYMFLNETAILQDLQHDNIVTLFHSMVGPTYGVLLLSYIPHGSLNYWLPDLSDDEKGSYFLQIASALRYVHSKHIVHRDLKLSNILVGYNQVYLTDFGLSERLPKDNPTVINESGTITYMAPEVLLKSKPGQGYDGYKADVFSLGACLWALLMKMEPQIYTRFIYDMEADKRLVLDPVLKACVHKLLAHDPCDRWNLDVLFEYLKMEEFRPEVIEGLLL